VCVRVGAFTCVFSILISQLHSLPSSPCFCPPSHLLIYPPKPPPSPSCSLFRRPNRGIQYRRSLLIVAARGPYRPLLIVSPCYSCFRNRGMPHRFRAQHLWLRTAKSGNPKPHVPQTPHPCVREAHRTRTRCLRRVPIKGVYTPGKEAHNGDALPSLRPTSHPPSLPPSLPPSRPPQPRAHARALLAGDEDEGDGRLRRVSMVISLSISAQIYSSRCNAYLSGYGHDDSE